MWKIGPKFLNCGPTNRCNLTCAIFKNYIKHERAFGSKNKSIDKVPDKLKSKTDSQERLPKYSELIKTYHGVKSRNLIVLFSWLEPKKNLVDQYASFYLNHKCDVVVVKLCWYYTLCAKVGPKAIVKDLVDFLDESKRYDRIVVHGFSAGLYLWGEVLDFMSQNPGKYEPIREKIVGQVWDSMVIIDNEELEKKFPKAILPQSVLLQKMFKNHLKMYLADLSNSSPHDYLPSFKHVREGTLVTSPVLVLGSHDDGVWSLQSVQDTIKFWRARGIQVDVKLWESSPHVEHLLYHKEEYEQALMAHLTKLNFLTNHDFESEKKKSK